MQLALALPGVITSCLLAYLLVRLLDKQHEERQAHRIEVTALTDAHAEQLAKLTAAHRTEVANLCQRLQAPEIAVAEHVGQQALSDPPQVDIEDDLALMREREKELDRLARDFEMRAEDMAVEQ